eukprot:COSAG05_NODE_1544_length_4590_cov_25.006012_5_plen_140_part_00
MPNMTWLSPPGWASSMSFNAFQPLAKRVTWADGGVARRAGFPHQTVDVFAATSHDGRDLSLRLVNAGNRSRVLSIRLLHGGSSAETTRTTRASPTEAIVVGATGAWQYNRQCAQQYVGKSQSCMVKSGRLIRHEPLLQS